ncbi:hypothetical protein BGX29_008353 [Mortierella sp. GBA35]|nr:hypothetical protein BGX29_008353 [Mortierella sp. GBA35]
MSALASSSSSNGNNNNKRGTYGPSSGSANNNSSSTTYAPATPSSSSTSPYNNSTKSAPSSSSTLSGFQRTPVHATIPKPKKYIGHYDIADRTFQLLSRHRAAACILFWSLTILLDILLQLPIEWFFLFYFILALVFRIFFIGGPIVLISIGAMCLANAFVFYTVPFSFTSPFATGVAFGLMVSLIHGLNLKGVILAMTMYMLKPYLERQTLIAALNPPTVPSIVFLAPLAAFCSAFGVLWLLYDLFGYLHASTDDLRDFFGITLPAPSLVTLKDVKDRSITLNWQCSSQATISKHLIEIDGLLIGESGKQETSVVIQGLYPDNTYRIRLWAITTRNWKTPSDYVVVRTLASVPVELELSSVENARRESELAKKSIEESKDPQHTAKVQDLENSTTTRQEDSAEKPDNTAPSQDTAGLFSGGNASASSLNSTVTTSNNNNNNNNMTSPSNATVHAIASAAPVVPIPTAAVVTDEQIAALRIELEEKEASHALLNQQFSNLEKQYKQQEDNLKNEIAALREQQKQEDEPRQQAKTKLKELQDSLREAEVNKSKVEKEHRMEVDRRQRITSQLEAKQRKVEALQHTLRQCEEKLKAEKESHRQQRLELEANLKKRQEEVATSEESLRALQASQKTLCCTIEAKESELSQLQATLQSPKGHLLWEQKSKDMDVKCALLAEEVGQYKQENQQLQERLAEATKNVTKVRSARDHRKAQAELRKTAARVSPVDSHTTTVAPLPELQHQNHGSSWMNAGWNQSPGTKILNGLFQDEPAVTDARPLPVRKTTGPPPGLTRKDSSQMESGSAMMMDNGLSGYGRDGKETGLQGAIGTSGSPSLLSSQAIVGPPKAQRLNSGWRPRSTSIMSSEYLLGDECSGSSSSGTTVAGGTNVFGEETDHRPGTRSRTSSISSFTGFQSPLFDPQFVFSTHAYQHHQDPNANNQLYQQQSRQPLHTGAQKSQVHGMSPRARLQGIGSSHSPPISHTPSPWGAAGSSTLKNVPGPIAAPVGAGIRSPLVDLEAKGSSNATSSPTFNYHHFFGPASTSTSIDHLPGLTGLEGSSLHGHQMNEQNVIKSMFESPDTLDLRHHLRTVGSHSSLATQAKILPSHLRSISTPGTSSPLSSPTTATHAPFQPWDHRVIGRPGSLGRMNSQAEGSSSSLNISDPSSPTSPHGSTSFAQTNGSSAFGSRKTLAADRAFWGGSGSGSGYGGVSMDGGILPSPTGSSGSSLDMGTPLPVDAHAFADQYFSHRGHRGYETPSSLSTAGFLSSSSSSLKHPLSTSSADSTGTSKVTSAAPGLGYGQQLHGQSQGQGYGHEFGQGSRTLQQSNNRVALGFASTASTATTTTQNGGSEADVFGYGLQFNPFGWTMPTGGFDERSSATTEDQHRQHQQDKSHAF